MAKRGRELPGGDDQRVVPRDHRTDNAERLASDQRERIRPGRRDLSVDLVDRLGVPRDALARARDVDVPRVGDRVTDVGRLELCEVLGVRVDELGPSQQDALSLERIGERPRAVVERAPRGAHREVDVLARAPRHLGNRVTVPGRDVRERSPIGGRDKPSPDERVALQIRTASRSAP